MERMSEAGRRWRPQGRAGNRQMGQSRRYVSTCVTLRSRGGGRQAATRPGRRGRRRVQVRLLAEADGSGHVAAIPQRCPGPSAPSHHQQSPLTTSDQGPAPSVHDWGSLCLVHPLSAQASPRLEPSPRPFQASPGLMRYPIQTLQQVAWVSKLDVPLSLLPRV